jgi:hypothetical protein
MSFLFRLFHFIFALYIRVLPKRLICKSIRVSLLRESRTAPITSLVNFLGEIKGSSKSWQSPSVSNSLPRKVS